MRKYKTSKRVREYHQKYYLEKLRNLCRCGNLKFVSVKRCRKCYHSNKFRGVSRLKSLKEKNENQL